MQPMKLIALITVAITGGLLIFSTGDLPPWGYPYSPASSSDLSRHYIIETRVQSEVPNMVTAVLADYRGFDTMFEAVVVFIAGLGILAVLRRPELQAGERLVPPTERSQDRDMITITTCRLMVPLIQLFALYVLIHGHYSPGGGFQGGVMFGASFILIALTSGLPDALLRLSEKSAVCIAALGLVIYAGTGLLCMFLGNNFLDYHSLSKLFPALTPERARYHSILIVEIGVAFTVAAIMFIIYAVLSSKGRMREGL